jgi:hypothetical protein
MGDEEVEGDYSSFHHAVPSVLTYELCPLSDILEARKRSISEIGRVSLRGSVEEDTYSVGSFRKSLIMGEFYILYIGPVFTENFIDFTTLCWY